MTQAQDAAGRLHAAGLRVTAARLAVLAALDEAGSGAHLSADEVAGRAPSVSVQAVYDVLDACTRVGLLRRTRAAGGAAARYETRVGDNHHHLTCRGCGALVDVDCVVGAAACLTPQDAGGFVVDEAEVLFHGLCPDCQRSGTFIDIDVDVDHEPDGADRVSAPVSRR